MDNVLYVSVLITVFQLLNIKFKDCLHITYPKCLDLKLNSYNTEKF
jgi:hypothetical protein